MPSQEDYPPPGGGPTVLRRVPPEGAVRPLPASREAAEWVLGPRTCFLPHCLGQEGAGKGAGATSGAGSRPVLGPDGEPMAHHCPTPRPRTEVMGESATLVLQSLQMGMVPPMVPALVPTPASSKQTRPGHGLCFRLSLLASTQPPVSPSTPASSPLLPRQRESGAFLSVRVSKSIPSALRAQPGRRRVPRSTAVSPLEEQSG